MRWELLLIGTLIVFALVTMGGQLSQLWQALQ